MDPVDVVGVALLHPGPGGRRVLAARRAGWGRDGWELPGGKLEPGESLAEAAVRELREELGCAIRVTAALAHVQPIDERHRLRVVVAELTRGEPVPLEHDALRWLAVHQLHEVGWLPADVPFLETVAEVLTEGGRELPGDLLRA